MDMKKISPSSQRRIQIEIHVSTRMSVSFSLSPYSQSSIMIVQQFIGIVIISLHFDKDHFYYVIMFISNANVIKFYRLTSQQE